MSEGDDRPGVASADEYRGWTRLQLRIRLRGPDLVPQRVTEQISVEPTRIVLKGEGRGRSTRHLAMWEWCSAWCDDQDTGALMRELLDTLGPHRAVLRHAVDAGASASVTIVSSVFGLVIESAEEADRRGWYSGEGESFVPFLAAGRVGVALGRDVLRFLVESGATFDTHIDAELDDDPRKTVSIDS
jgi:hypothetical protein